MMIQVWSKPSCIQCDATKVALELKGKEYEEFNLLENPEALEEFKAAGHMAAPIVVTEKGTWSGFRLELIQKL